MAEKFPIAFIVRRSGNQIGHVSPGTLTGAAGKLQAGLRIKHYLALLRFIGL
jgi:hypothetical protein